MDESPNSADDRQRLSDWVRQHGRAVYGYVLRFVRDADAADDLTQDVFRKAWQSREAYREQGTARAYLLRIADRLACDRYRRSHPSVHWDDESWQKNQPSSREDEPSSRLERAETERQLAAALDNLSPSQRRVLALRYYGDLSFAEIAETLEVPLNTVLSHCHRGLKTLRRMLESGTLESGTFESNKLDEAEDGRRQP